MRLATVLYIAMIVLVSIGVVWVPIQVVERKQRKTCPGCLEGTVLFTDQGSDLCHKHWERWDRVRQLEDRLDYELRLAENQDETW